MELFIHNFRGIKERNFKLENGLTLFKGASGSGKSTVLEAIRWCLFGQLRQVLPFNGDKKTKVKIIIDDITITRSKNPETLFWQKGDLELQASEAQAQIEAYFGSKDLWQISSYIGQENRNILLAGSQNDKLKIIKELVFANNAEKSNQLLTVFKEKKESLNKESHQFNYMLTRLKEKNEEFIKDNKEAFDTIKEDFFQSKLYKSKELLLQKQEEITNKIKNNKEQIIINQMLKEKETELIKYQDLLKPYPSGLTYKKFVQWQKYLEAKENITSLNTEEDMLIPESLDDLLKLFAICDNNKRLLKKYNLSSNNIKAEINKCNEDIEQNYQYDNYQKQYKIYNDYQKNIIKYEQYLQQIQPLENAIFRNWKFLLVKLNMEYQNYTHEYMTLVEEKLKTVKNGSLVCPQCDCKLQLKGSKLIACSIILEPEVIAKLNKIIINIKQYYQNKDECLQKLNTLSENAIEEPVEVNKPKINDLQSLKQKNIDLNQYQELDEKAIINKITILKAREKKKLLKETIDNNYHSFFDTFEINDDNYIEKFIEYQNNINKCQEYLNKYENKEIIDIAKEEKLLVRVEGKLVEIKEQEYLYEKKDILDRLEKEYNLEKEKYELAIEHIKYCDKIIKIINESENESFQQFISYFNALINDILIMLFDNCTIELKAFKEKSKEIKAQIDVHIFIDGQKYENWHLLSGGEKDRISLAITIALAYLKNAKFLLLDECMASLDGQNREKCLRVFKKYISKKIVLNVCHETIEGYYDYVIDY